MDDPRSDNELMLGVRGGDLHALGLLFRRHRDKVHALCRRLVGDASVADDLVQETFFRILRYGHGFKGSAQFTTWMYRIARNTAMSHVNRESRRSDQEAEVERDSAIRREGTYPSESELVEALGSAIADLPAEQREVLVLSRYHDLRYEQIAEVCECSVAAVKSRVYRAMRTLRQQLGAREQSNEPMRRNER